MPSSNGAPSGGFSLFPNTTSTSPPSRKTTPRPRVITSPSPSRQRGPSIEMTSPQNGRHTPESLLQFVIDGTPPGLHKTTFRDPDDLAGPSMVSQPVPISAVPPRTETAMSGTSTVVRSSSYRSRSSIAKRPLDEDPSTSSSSPGAEVGLRSIFPQYDYSLPLDRQEYYPTQTSPSHIPRTVISRQTHVPQSSENRSPLVRSPIRSPLSDGSAQRWPRRPHEPPVIPPVSTTDSLRDYWKAANGWKASETEGRSYCMKLTAEKDTPIYNLSSTTKTFYHMRVNPTSASAYITLSRHDPSKPFKERDPNADAKSPGGILAALREPERNKTWHEVVNTTLEEESRRLPPEDGLVALIYPCAATKMALDKPGDISAVMTAERECARLVWDEDSKNYFLVHPALATPFCITVEKNQAWSRIEYTLEHIGSPQHLAKLTRDGTGEGYMELDTLVAGRVDSFYILDVAVCALLIVANMDEKNHIMEQFEPPPMFPPAAHLRGDGEPKRTSLMSKMSKKERKKRAKMEEFELDLESQTSSLGSKLDGREKDKLPGVTRTLIKLLSVTFKCVIWVLTITFKALRAIVVGLSKCLTSEKL